MDEAWNRWDGLPDGLRDGRSGQDSEEAAFRLNRRSGSFREPPATDASARYRDAGSPREPRRPGRGVPEPLDQRLDRWMSRGRELVDGVAGARPGSRMAGSEGAVPGHRGLGAGGLNPARLGRWVEERLDWLLEDDADDDWREPWQETARMTGRRPAPPVASESAGARRLERPNDPWAAPAPPVPSGRRGDLEPRPPVVSERRALEAVSRRSSRIGTPVASPSPQAGAVADGPEAWPDDATFTLQRWKRTPPSAGAAPLAAESPAPPASPPGRPLPRSSRRR